MRLSFSKLLAISGGEATQAAPSSPNDIFVPSHMSQSRTPMGFRRYDSVTRNRRIPALARLPPPHSSIARESVALRNSSISESDRHGVRFKSSISNEIVARLRVAGCQQRSRPSDDVSVTRKGADVFWNRTVLRDLTSQHVFSGVERTRQ